MNDNTYNGWTNRETWLVNVWNDFNSASELEFYKEQLEEEVENMPSGMIKDMINLDKINWDELKEAIEE